MKNSMLYPFIIRIKQMISEYFVSKASSVKSLSVRDAVARGKRLT
jgi:hypothetical protein